MVNNVNDDISKALTDWQRRTREQAAANAASESLLKTNEIQWKIAGQKERARELTDQLNITPQEESGWLDRVFSALDVPGKYIARPLLGGALRTAYEFMPGEQEGEKALREAVGINPFSVITNQEEVRSALKEANLPWYVQLPFEMALDPTTYMGYGAISKGVKAAKKITSGEESAQKALGLTGGTRDVVLADGTVIVKRTEDLAPEDRLTPLVSIKKRLPEVLPDNKFRREGERLAKIPIIKQMVGAFNPSVLASDEIGKPLITYSQLVVDGDNLASVTASYFRVKSKNPFSIVDGFVDGIIDPDTGKNIAIGDLIQKAKRPKLWAKLSDEQKLYVDEYQGVLRKAKELLDAAGVKIKDIDFAPGDVYMPRIATGGAKAFDFEEIRSIIGGPVGTKQAYQKVRHYESMMEGLDKGVPYLTDPAAILEYHLKGVYRTIADKKLVDHLAPLGKTRKNVMDLILEESNPNLVSNVKNAARRRTTAKLAILVLNRAMRGEKVPTQTINKIKKEFPSIGEAFDQAKKATTQRVMTKEELRSKFSPMLKTLAPAAGLEEVVTETVRKRTAVKPPRKSEQVQLQLGDSVDPRGIPYTRIEVRQRAQSDALMDSILEEGGLEGAEIVSFALGQGGVKGILGKALKDMKSIEVEEISALKGLNNQLSGARKRAQQSLSGPGAIRQPGFAGRVFDVETATEVNKYFDARTNPILKGLSETNSVLRLGMTGFDFGAGMIQGLPLLVTRPAAWARAQKASVDALKDPQAFAAYVNKHANTVQKMAQHGGPVDMNEFVEAAIGGGAAQRLLRKAGRPGRFVEREIVDRASAQFTQFGVAARVELFEAYEPMIRRAASKRGITDERKIYEDLTQFVMKMTGTTGVERLGVRGTRLATERVLLFAPRYLRATVGLLADVFQGGLRGEVARDGVFKTLGAGTVMYIGWAAALGQEPKLDPTRGDFLTVEIGGQRVGWGGAWVSLARTAAQMYPQIRDNPDPRDSILSFDPQKSPLARFIRYKTSPITGLGWDVATGRDAIGRPTAIGSPLEQPLEFLKDTPNYFAPFWAQQLPEHFLGDEDPLSRDQNLATTMPSEFVGMRSFPTSVFSERSIRRDQMALGTYNKPWDELTGLQKKVVEERDEILKELNIETRQYGLESSDDLTRNRAEYAAKAESYREARTNKVDLATQEWKEGKSTGKAWRDRIKSSGQSLREAYEEINGENSIFQPAIASFEEFKLKNSDGKRLIEDVAYDEYVQRVMIGQPEEVNGEILSVSNEFGEIDYEERDRRESEIKAKYDKIDPQIFEDIKIRGKLFSDFQPESRELFEEYIEGVEQFRPYWEIGEKLASQRNLSAEWRTYQQHKARFEGARIKQDNPGIAEIESIISKTRAIMRKRSPALDAFLYKFQYTSTLVNPLALSIGMEAIEQYDFQSLNLPSA